MSSVRETTTFDVVDDFFIDLVYEGVKHILSIEPETERRDAIAQLFADLRRRGKDGPESSRLIKTVLQVAGAGLRYKGANGHFDPKIMAKYRTVLELERQCSEAAAR